MARIDQCRQCADVLSKQPFGSPSGLAQMRQNYNCTTYRCSSCGSRLQQRHVPHGWAISRR